MIDTEEIVQEAIREYTDQLTAAMAKPVIRASAIPPAKVITGTQFAALPNVACFQVMTDREQLQAAFGIFGRLVALASAGLDQTSERSRLTEMMLADCQSQLQAMWGYSSESQATSPDEFAATDLSLLRQLMAACVAKHGARSDQHRQFFELVTGGALGSQQLTSTAQDWILCQ